MALEFAELKRNAQELINKAITLRDRKIPANELQNSLSSESNQSNELTSLINARIALTSALSSGHKARIQIAMNALGAILNTAQLQMEKSLETEAEQESPQLNRGNRRLSP